MTQGKYWENIKAQFMFNLLKKKTIKFSSKDAVFGLLKMRYDLGAKKVCPDIHIICAAF